MAVMLGEAAVGKPEGQADEARDHAGHEEDPLRAGRRHHLGIEPDQQGSRPVAAAAIARAWVLVT